MTPLFQRRSTVAEEEERPKAAPEQAGTAAENAAGGSGAESGAESTRESGAAAGPHEGPQEALIPASKLPPAGDALAQLFAEAPATEAAPSEPAEPPALAPAVEPENPVSEAEAKPKRKGFLARLFAAKRTQKKTPAEESADAAQPTAVEAVSAPGEAAAAAAAAEATAAVAEASAAPAVVSDAGAEKTGGGPGESLILAEIPNIFAAAPVAKAAADAMEVEALKAEELPSAAKMLEELFPAEETETSPAADEDGAADAESADADDAAIAATLEEIPGYATVEATAREEEESGEEEEGELSGAAEGDPATLETETAATAGAAGSEVSAAVAAEISRGNEPAAPAGGPVDGPRHLEIASPESDGSGVSLEVQAAAAAMLSEPRRLYKDWALDEKLASHGEWVESHGRTGQRADLSGAELEASDLISVNLRLADLHDANLRASDLLLADLRDACLVRADLEEACLVGANLEGANLEGASLETAMGLVPRQFAGANLRDALLAPHLMEFDAVTAYERESKNAFRYFWIMSAVSALSWLAIAKTRDAQLLTDSAILPFLHSRAAAAALPTAESYLIAPVALFVLYVLFHYHLQRLWDSVVELPAIFPDGHTLGDAGPGIISSLLRTHFRWMNPDPSSTRLVEKSASLAAAYWIVPATLLLYWARYLTRQEIHGTILQALLAATAAGMATYATLKVGRRQERWAFENRWAQRAVRRIKAVNPIPVASALGAVLLLLSAGVIFGVPHDRSRAPQFGIANARRWAPDVFWWLAYDPYPDLTEASISRRPAGWNGADEQVGTVDGLRANNAKFRYAQGYGAFLANSHLWRADFQGAFLSEGDLRGADLGQSNMRYAVMDHAHMSRANFDRSNLDGADLRRADLREANLSYCSLDKTVLVDARLEGASFYTARLPGADLTRAILEKADLRESQLIAAHMDHADLRSAYLWSAKLIGADLGGAQLEGAILIDADLHGANLGGAQLTGTVLNGADLTGTSLEGADLRGALGLSVSQVCSAKSRRGATLDPDMETLVEGQCGKP